MNKLEDFQVVACIDTFEMYSTIMDNENPEEVLKEANEHKISSIDTYKRFIAKDPANERNKYLLEQHEKRNYQIMNYSEYSTKQKAYYLSKPLYEVTEEKYNDMLNILPPVRWQTVKGCEEFLMSEFLTGTITSQYATKNGKYYSKLVDAADRSTWIHNLI